MFYCTNNRLKSLKGLLFGVSLTFMGLNAWPNWPFGKSAKPKSYLRDATEESVTNADQLLNVFCETLENCLKDDTFYENFETSKQFLDWLVTKVEPNKKYDTMFSRTPYFNKTNLEQLYLLLGTLQTYLKTKIVGGQSRIDLMFRDFRSVVDQKTPVGAYAIKEPSFVEKGIFRKNMVKFSSGDFLAARLSLVGDTNARNVFGDLCHLLAELQESMSRTYMNYEGFCGTTNASTRAFVQEHTKGVAESLRSFLDKLAKNVSINPEDAKFYKTTPYFDKGNFSVLKGLLETLRHFCTYKMCINKAVVDPMFNEFYAKYPATN